MILLDSRDRRPIYEQIIDKLSDLMMRGILTKDSPLPSVRSLAADLSINPNTVQRAYMELERSGYIYSIKAKGSFVADITPLKEKEEDRLYEEMRTLAERAAGLGISKEDFLEKAGRCYDETEKKGERV